MACCDLASDICHALIHDGDLKMIRYHTFLVRAGADDADADAPHSVVGPGTRQMRPATSSKNAFRTLESDATLVCVWLIG